MLSVMYLKFNRNEDLAKNHMAHANATIDSNQESSTKLLRDRTHSVYRLQTALERAIKGQMEEYSSLAEQRCRLLNALIVLKMPESIGTYKFIYFCLLILPFLSHFF